MGVIPGAQYPLMSSLAFPVSLTLMVYITYMYLGMKSQGPIKFFTSAMFPPGVPKAMYGLLAPLELLQLVVTRPVTQAIRLFANMFAGHLLLMIFILGGEHLLQGAIGLKLVSPFAFAFGIALTFFEFLVQCLQAYIFTLLTALYIGGALADEH
jgi:F-type H+-transporting ATPase subunit a